MTPEERYAALVDELVGKAGAEPPAGGPQRFGSTSVKVNGKMFAMFSHGKLVVKLPEKRVAELAAAGTGEQWDAGKGRIQKEWMALAPGAEDQWLAVAHEALSFVGGAGRKGR